MMDAVDASLKHIFIDIVGFTRQGRTIEAQTDIVAAMNQAVRDALATLAIPTNAVILIPTGDGLCLSLVAIDHPYDVHMQLALAILQNVAHYSDSVDDSRAFQVRIGINDNVDNLIVDINGMRNVAGAGISIASRIMDFADASQILVSHTVVDRLQHREKYANAFRMFKAPPTKHGLELIVHQYVSPDVGVNCDLPSRLAPPHMPISIPKFIAFYLAHALKNHDALLANKTLSVASTLLLWYLALDSTAADDMRYWEAPQPTRVLGPSNATFEERLRLYEAVPYSIARDVCREMIAGHLAPYSKCFVEDINLVFGARFVSPEGEARLRAQWRRIWDDFGLL